MGTVTASGIPEAIAAAILVLAIGKVLLGVFRKMNIGMLRKQMYRGKKTFRLKKESREVFFCYVFIRKKLPVTGSVDTKNRNFAKNKKIEKFC